jgi:hypothetical protein
MNPGQEEWILVTERNEDRGGGGLEISVRKEAKTVEANRESVGEGARLEWSGRCFERME